jgi:hypothetical protein
MRRYLDLILVSVFILPVLSLCCSGGSPLDPTQDFALTNIVGSEVLSSPPVYAYDVQVAVSPLTGEIYCCWVHKEGGVPEVFWRHGRLGSFAPEEAITDLDSQRSFNPSIYAGPDGKVHFAWMDQKVPMREVYEKTWQSGQWGPEILLSLNDLWTGWDPCVRTYPDGRPVVCWFDHRFDVQHEIMLRVADQKGVWGPDVRMTNDDFWQYCPDIAIDRFGLLHLSYVDAREQPGRADTKHFGEGKNLEIYYRTWDGSVIGPEVRITNTALRSIESRIAVDNEGRAHLIWLDETSNGYYSLYYTSIKNNKPSATHQVTSPGCRGDMSAIACLGNRVFVAYPEFADPHGPETGQAAMCFREIHADGLLGERRFLATTGTNIHPRMVSDPTRRMLWVIWTEYIGDDETLETGQSRIHLCAIKVREP